MSDIVSNQEKGLGCLIILIIIIIIITFLSLRNAHLIVARVRMQRYIFVHCQKSKSVTSVKTVATSVL